MHGSTPDLDGGSFSLSPADINTLRQGHPLFRCLNALKHVMQQPAAAPFCSQVINSFVRFYAVLIMHVKDYSNSVDMSCSSLMLHHLWRGEKSLESYGAVQNTDIEGPAFKRECLYRMLGSWRIST